MIMCMHLIDDIFEDDLGGWKGQDIKGYSVVPGGVPIEEVGLHPGRVPGVLHEKMIEIGVITDTLYNQIPVTVKKYTIDQ